MYHRTIFRKELEYRVDYQDIKYWKTGACPKSFGWLASLLKELDSAEELETDLCKVLQKLADSPDQTKEDRDRIQFELAHVPVRGTVLWKEKKRFCVEFRGGSNPIHWPFNTATFPQNALPEDCSLETLEVDSIHWFFFTLSELRQLRLASESSEPFRKVDPNRINDPIQMNRGAIKTWQEMDSIIRWVMQFASTNGESHNPQITRHEDSTEDVYWKLHLPIKPTIESTLETQSIQTRKMTAKDKILQFIQEQDEVTTAQIETQQFCKRRYVYIVLKELIGEGKIVKLAHGRYMPVKS